MNAICLDENYSTTRLVIKEKPEIVNNSEDKFETVLFLPEGEGRKGEGGLRTKGYFKKSYEGKPLISIITVVYNGKEFLEETIESVINQTYDNVEYIIIDGGSTDGTIDIIRKYENMIDYWVSERDRGMYEAIHKGFTCATGQIFAWLNADDIYYPWSLNSVAKVFEKYSNINWLTGIPSHINKNTEMINVEHPKYYFQYFIKKGYYRGDYFGFIQQESTFFRKCLYKKRPLNTNLKLAGDYNLWLNFADDSELKTVKVILSSFRMHGNQKSNDIKKYYDECNITSEGSKVKILKYFFKPISILLNSKLIRPITWESR